MSNTVTPVLLRRRDVAARLGVSESQVLKFERQGLLHPFTIPGLRATRFDAAEVDALAKRWIAEAREPVAAGAA